MKNKIAALVLLAVLSMLVLNACDSPNRDAAAPESSGIKDGTATGEQTESKDAKQDERKQDFIMLEFSDIDYGAKNYEQYDGVKVKIRGYMSSMSPLDGKFIYLMNIPYQNCPFCMPSTTDIESSVAVYAPDGRRIDFYDGAIEVTGTLEVGDTVDEFGYYYPFKLIDASYIKLDTSQLSENAKMYGALSQDGIITDIMNIANQIHINAFFETYDDMTFNDVLIIEADEFDSIIKRINAINKSDYADLVSILDELKDYNAIINENIEAREYSANTTNEMADRYYYLLDSLYAWLNKFKI